MQEIEQVGGRRPQSLDPDGVQLPDRRDDLSARRAARARVEKVAERALILRGFVDIRNAKLRLPQECVIGALEDLPLFGDRVNDRLER